MTNGPDFPNPPPQPTIPDGLSDTVKAELLKLEHADSLERALFPWKEKVGSGREIFKAETDARLTHEEALNKWEHDSVAAVEGAYLEAIKARFDHSVKRVEVYLGLVTAFLTAYGTLLALRFGADQDTLDWLAMVPAVLFGLALVLSGWYLVNLLPDLRDRQPMLSNYSLVARQSRLSEFESWTRDAIKNQSWALKVSVIVFALGLVSAPVALMNIDLASLEADFGVPIVAVVAIIGVVVVSIWGRDG